MRQLSAGVLLALLAVSLTCALCLAEKSPKGLHPPRAPQQPRHRTTTATPPHIIHIVADDLGYNDLGLFNGEKTHTPYINSLIQQGMWLNDFYAWKICAPSRTSAMTGRLPFNVGYYDMTYDENHCASNFTMMPELLRQQGYVTHAIGKWDVGFIKKECTPTYNGFDSFLGYYSACTANYWYHGSPFCKLSSQGGLVSGTDFTLANGSSIMGAPMTGPSSLNGTYDRVVFQDRAIDIIRSHDASQPLYLYVAFHNVHDACSDDRFKNGLNAPKASVDLYPNTILDTWKVQAAMTTELDYGVANITEALKAAGLYDNSVLFFWADNGGPLDHSTNAPLRGGKATMFEGGFRVAAFVHSPLLPARLQGSTYHGIMHVADLYRTCVEGLAGGVVPNNTGPMPVDSLNIWPSIISNSTSPRLEVVLEVANQYSRGASAMRYNHYKLIRGAVSAEPIVPWPTPADQPVPFGKTSGYIEAGTDHAYASLLKGDQLPKTGGKICDPYCLFHVLDDPSESTDLAKDPKYKSLIEQMLKTLDAAGAAAPPPAYVDAGNITGSEKQICEDQIATGYLEPLDWK